MTLTQSKVKVTELLNFRKLPKLSMHAGGDDRQPHFRAFWLDHGLGDILVDLLKSGVFVRPSTKFFSDLDLIWYVGRP